MNRFSFTDRRGREWQVAVNRQVDAIIRRRLGVAIVGAAREGERFIYEVRNPVDLALILFLVVGGQAEAAGVTLEDFLGALDLSVIAEGRARLFLSLAHYLDNPLFWDLFVQIRDREERIEELNLQKIEDLIERLDLAAELFRTRTKEGN